MDLSSDVFGANMVWFRDVFGANMVWTCLVMCWGKYGMDLFSDVQIWYGLV